MNFYGSGLRTKDHLSAIRLLMFMRFMIWTRMESTIYTTDNHLAVRNQ